MTQIVVTISPQGTIVLQTQGFAGNSCRDASRALEQALGLVTHDAPTSECFVSASTQEPAEQRAQM